MFNVLLTSVVNRGSNRVSLASVSILYVSISTVSPPVSASPVCHLFFPSILPNSCTSSSSIFFCFLPVSLSAFFQYHLQSQSLFPALSSLSFSFFCIVILVPVSLSITPSLFFNLFFFIFSFSLLLPFLQHHLLTVSLSVSPQFPL